MKIGFIGLGRWADAWRRACAPRGTRWHVNDIRPEAVALACRRRRRFKADRARHRGRR